MRADPRYPGGRAFTRRRSASVLVARHMSERWLLLDRYRDKLNLAGVAGVPLAMLLGYLRNRRAATVA